MVRVREGARQALENPSFLPVHLFRSSEQCICNITSLALCAGEAGKVVAFLACEMRLEGSTCQTAPT